AQFGPVILFGSGGQLVEVYRDRALALPPLNSTLAARIIDIARAEKIPAIVAHILSENAPMLALARRFHFTSSPSTDSSSLTVILHLE
ncbi:MAG: acetate--CoA ligase family protein, partial [Candidatus Acidiferrum sp.]